MSDKLKCELEGEERDEEQRQACGLMVREGLAHARSRGTGPANCANLSQEPDPTGSQSSSPRNWKSSEGGDWGPEDGFLDEERSFFRG